MKTIPQYICFSKGCLQSRLIFGLIVNHISAGGGALHWVPDAQLPTRCQWTEEIPTNAENRPKVGDIATVIHSKRLEEYCVHDGRCACRDWV